MSRGRLDPLGYDSAEELLDGGASTHRRARASARRPAAAPSRGELRSAARREKAQMNPRVRARAPKPIFVWPESARGRRMQMDGSRLADRVVAQAGRAFPGPGPGYGLECWTH
jgi:hypothetical protein